MKKSTNTNVINDDIELFSPLQIEHAYKLLKQEIYYDSVNLHNRLILARFESSGKIGMKETFIQLARKLSTINTSDNYDSYFQDLFQNIDCKIITKSISDKVINKNNPNLNEEKESESEFEGFLISNLKSYDKYYVTGANYFIFCPIEILLISTLWTLEVGVSVDKELDEKCLGNRLQSSFYSLSNRKMFKYYLPQYNLWRDKAISTAINLISNQHDVLLVALDIKQCYYSCRVNWVDFTKKFISNTNGNRKIKFEILTKLLEHIHDEYHKKSKEYLEFTHVENDIFLKPGLPVGLPSSGILANWILSKLDQNIKEKINPAYYGRYVDDLILIIQNPPKYLINGFSSKVQSSNLLDYYFIKPGLFEEEPILKNEYKIRDFDSLYVNTRKFIFHYYEKNHNLAGLSEFKKELEKQASEFRFLPLSDQDIDLNEFAYDLQHKGSINTLRSLIGINENGTEFSKYLSRKIIENRLCDKEIDDEQIAQLFRFYRGKNIFDFYRLWEKVFSLLIINQDYESFGLFAKEVSKTIKKISHSDITLKNKIITDAQEYLGLAISIPLGLTSYEQMSKFLTYAPKKIQELFCETQDKSIKNVALSIRQANLIRHEFVSWPLLNYTNYDGDLLRFSKNLFNEEIQLQEYKLNFSPRILYFSEFQLSTFLSGIKNLAQDKTINKNNISDILETIDLYKSKTNFWSTDIEKYITTNEMKNDHKIDAQTICINESQVRDLLNHPLTISIANMKVEETNIAASYNPLQSPNLSFKRQAALFGLINESINDPKSDIIVFPEVSIPYSWLPMMVNQARRKNVGMVFGLEHIVINQIIFNIVVTVLPTNSNNDFKECIITFRNKNHYSPMEEHEFHRLGFSIPKFRPTYHRFKWNSTSFSVYNCYELSDINHRSIFRSKLDFLIAVEWNKDTPYYSNIIESCARDLHCYMVQVNTSQFGDSRITAPQDTERKNKVQVSGGINEVQLKTRLEIPYLRDFQIHTYSPEDKRFKPTPAGFDRDEVENRL